MEEDTANNVIIMQNNKIYLARFDFFLCRKRILFRMHILNKYDTPT